MLTLKVKTTLTEEMLGMHPSNPDIHREYIASKSPDAKTIEDEVAAIGVEAALDKSMTIFPKFEGKPFMYDYQIKGSFKDACGMLTRVKGTKSSAIKAYKKIIDGLIFVYPRRIMIETPRPLTDKDRCTRPLRAQTAQGERIALVTSETVPIGSTMQFEVVLLDEGHVNIVTEWLDYGKMRGFGQWRNSGCGKYEWEELDRVSKK